MKKTALEIAEDRSPSFGVCSESANAFEARTYDERGRPSVRHSGGVVRPAPNTRDHNMMSFNLLCCSRPRMIQPERCRNAFVGWVKPTAMTASGTVGCTHPTMAHPFIGYNPDDRTGPSGAELIAEIADAVPRPGSLVIWWLGQSGFLIKSPQGLLAVDLYLSEHLTEKYESTSRPHVRMTRAAVRGHELQRVDLVLASHKHSDHLDPGTIPDLFSASPGAVLVLPESILDHALQLGLPRERLVGLDAGDTMELAGFRVHAIPSAHEGLDTDQNGRHLYVGYVIESAGRRLYHSGDSLAYPGLSERLGSDPFDVLFLPINGRDPARGVPGNMTAAEAVDLAAAVRPRFVVPHHYDMFTFNTVPVEVFAAEARRLPAGVEPRILSCGERREITP